MAIEMSAFAPGTRVRITQQIPAVRNVTTTSVEGTVLRYRQSKTGSWFAHSLHDRLWLDRLEVQKDDGEITVMNLDQYTVIEPLARRTERSLVQDCAFFRAGPDQLKSAVL